MMVISVPVAFFASMDEFREYKVLLRLLLSLTLCLLGPVVMVIFAKDYYNDFVIGNSFYRSFARLWRHLWSK
jgi:hypothetical protein